MKLSQNIIRLGCIAGLLPLLLIWCSSCSNTRFLEEGETLYIGNKVKVEDSTFSKSRRKAMTTELSDIIRPRPNRSFLGIRFKLWVYNMAGEPKSEIGLRHWLRNKIGEPPVYGSDMNIKTNIAILNNYLQNQGYFSAVSKGEKITNKKRTEAFFTVHPGIQDSIRKVTFSLADSTKLGRHIYATKDKSLLRPGRPYNLNVIITERERITQVLKNEGYYYFNPEYIIIKADTGIAPHQIDLTVSLKMDKIARNAFYQYRMNKVTIIPNYRMTTRKSNNNKDSKKNWQRRRQGDTTYYPEGFGIVERHNSAFRPHIFRQAMQLKPGELYNLRDQNIALNRLINLGAFKFVKNEFTPVRDSSGKHLLDLTYYLSPYPKKSLSADIGGYTQNDNRVGSRASISWMNHNTFRGAEIFTIKVSGGFDMQYGGEVKTPNIYNLGIDASLNIPKFVIPFATVKPSSMYVPRTLIKAGYNYALGKDYYKITSFSLGFGYNWKEDAMKEHKLFPINISYVKTDTLDVSKANEFNLSNLTFNGLIFGPTYEYTYNSQLGSKVRIDNYYFNGVADFSGNILGWAQGTSLNKSPKEIFGLPYAQYAKLQADFRYYHNYTSEKILATRVFLGFGFPYGNSHTLPNVKQFFSGGSSSLRGFSSRLVGPGTYHYTRTSNNNVFIEMLGDIKLELNAEYRLPIYQFIKGAFFADAGNIWLYRENSDFPGGTFSSNFYNQLAVDVGAGLRLDFSILVLRLDLGIPIRKPWYPKGERWRFNDLRFGNPDWRQSNLFFNLAIGYPF